MDSKPLAVGLLFGVGMALTLKSWLLGIMFGIIFLLHLTNQIRTNILQAVNKNNPHSWSFLFVE